MVTKTFEETVEIINLINRIKVDKDDKVSYAVKKIGKGLTKEVQKIQNDMNDELMDSNESISVKNASIDSDGNLRFDDVTMTDGGVKRVYRFTPENKLKEQKESKAAQKAIIEDFKKKTISFKEFIVLKEDATRLYDMFDEEELEVLDGILIQLSHNLSVVE